MSCLVVNITLAVPSMILGETALSFLGLGIRPPAVRTVLAFNFLGDGLADAADPYR